jgi:hypothetical protein
MSRILVLALAGILGLSMFSPAPASANSTQGASKLMSGGKHHHKGHHHKHHHHKK